MKKFSVLLSLAVGFLFAQNSQAQNILQNGKLMEDAQGWQTAKSEAKTIEFSTDFKSYGLADNFAGLGFVELDGVSAIQQTVKATKGERYTLAYSYSHRPNAGDKQLIVLVNGKPIYTEKIANNAASGGFMPKSLTFIAEQEELTIGFLVASLGGDDNVGVLLRDVLLGKESEVDLNLYYSY